MKKLYRIKNNSRIGKRRRKRFIAGILDILACILFFIAFVSAANQADVTSEDGKIKYTTIDTRASSGIRWKTVGFTITKEKCLSGSKANGGYPTKLKHATIWLERSQKTNTDLGNGTQRTEFVLSKEDVDDALVQCGLEGIQDNDVLYLHGIFQVTHNGSNYGSKIYNLPDIKKAESWRNPNDFNDRFDIKVLYHAGKEPVVIEYRTTKGELIEKITYPKKDYVKTGDKVKVSLDQNKTFKSKEYVLIRSYYVQNKYSTSRKEIKKVAEAGLDAASKRTFKQCLGGIRIVAIMGIDRPDDSDSYMYGELEDMEAVGTITSKQFEVTEGIPSSEQVDIHVEAPVYCREYTFQKLSGQKTYPIALQVVYHLSWQEEIDGHIQPMSEQITKTYHTEVTREYSYWTIDNLTIYKIKSASVSNAAIKDGEVQLLPSVQEKEIKCITYDANAHMKEPETGQGYETHVSLSGGSERPQIQETDISILKKADSLVPKIKVRNDYLLIGNLGIMNNNWSDEKTVKPVPIPEFTERTGEGELDAENVLIPAEKKNAVYQSSGYVSYKPFVEAGFFPMRGFEIDISDINAICVHTPVVCVPCVEDQRKYNQEIVPDKSRAALVLDTDFSISFSTVGEHLSIKGYGYRDYRKYTKNRKIRFPFDVYINGQYRRAGSICEMDGTELSCYLPTWVTEGDYAIEFFSASINSDGTDGSAFWEDRANLDRENYVAYRMVPVHVSGRLYGMQVYDISDYPLWRDVFRIKGKTEWNGFSFHAGYCDSFGIFMNRETSLPIMRGSHPFRREEGVVPCGYYIRYRITTIGNLSGSDDYIHIKPEFYYCSKDGNIREEVDVYYGEEIGGHYYPLVKVGSEKDKENQKTVNLWNPYLAVPEDLRMGKQGQPKIYTYQNIMLSEHLRSYEGSTRLKYGILPEGVAKEKMQQSVQYWYGEYHLPATVHVTNKGTDVYGYGKNHGITFEEPFWHQNGYLLVSFRIETIDEKERHLSYVNDENAKDGYCNMWDMEKQPQMRTDSGGNLFRLEFGDVLFYDLARNTSKDYVSAGTH